MFVVLLNVVVISIIIGIAALLSLIAVILIIVSLVRAYNAKRKGKKTLKAGLWIGIIMLVTPWILVGSFIIYAEKVDKENHRLEVNRKILGTAVLARDAETLYGLMAEDVTDRNDITEEDVEEFLSACTIQYTVSDDLDRYTDMSQPQTNHYRNYTSEENGRRQTCFQYRMYDVNSDGGVIYITGVDGDPEGEEYVGIYYMSYTLDDITITLGEQPPREP